MKEVKEIEPHIAEVKPAECAMLAAMIALLERSKCCPMDWNNV